MRVIVAVFVLCQAAGAVAADARYFAFAPDPNRATGLISPEGCQVEPGEPRGFFLEALTDGPCHSGQFGYSTSVEAGLPATFISPVFTQRVVLGRHLLFVVHNADPTRPVASAIGGTLVFQLDEMLADGSALFLGEGSIRLADGRNELAVEFESGVAVSAGSRLRVSMTVTNYTTNAARLLYGGEYGDAGITFSSGGAKGTVMAGALPYTTVLLFLMAALLGCGQSATPGAPRSLQADCALPGANRVDGGVCVRMFDFGGRDSEASIAAHPSNAGTVALSWIGNSGRIIFAAVTTDFGKTWKVRELRPQAEIGATMVDVADPTTAIAPDGTIHVAILASYNDGSPLALASSRDGGLSWEYRRVQASLGGFFPDYPEVTVAPDTGHLYIVAQDVVRTAQPGPPFINCLTPVACPSPEHITLRKSVDGGKSWTEPEAVMPSLSAVGLYFRSPRITAGRNGLLVATANGSALDSSAAGAVGGYAAVSRDGGESWSTPIRIRALGADMLAKPIAIVETHGAEPRLHAIYPDGVGIVGYRDEGGGTWSGPHALFSLPSGTSNVWLATAAGRSGDVYAEYRYGASDRFAVGLTRWHADGSAENRILVDIAGQPGEHMRGDDYGAIAIAADGAVWTAWSDPRGKNDEAIALSRIVSTSP